MKYKILFVDDDMNLLDGLRRSLHAKATEWDMSFASSADEAITLCGKTRYDVIVSDYKMPGMDGLTLLQKISGESPDTRTILLSGQTEETTFERVKESVDVYLSKPCAAPAIIEAVEKLFAGGDR